MHTGNACSLTETVLSLLSCLSSRCSWWQRATLPCGSTLPMRPCALRSGERSALAVFAGLPCKQLHPCSWRAMAVGPAVLLRAVPASLQFVASNPPQPPPEGLAIFLCTPLPMAGLRRSGAPRWPFQMTRSFWRPPTPAQQLSCCSSGPSGRWVQLSRSTKKCTAVVRHSARLDGQRFPASCSFIGMAGGLPA